MKEPVKLGVGVVVIKGGKTLLTKRKGSHAAKAYGSIGGHVEYGESPLEAIKREAREELGVEIGNMKLVSCVNMVKYGKHYFDITFTGEIISGEPQIQEPDRIESVAWYSLDDLPSPLFEPVRIALEAMNTGKVYYEIKE